MLIKIFEKCFKVLKLFYKIVCDQCYKWVAPRYTAPTVRTLNFIEGALGGLLKSKYVDKKVKYLWLAYNLSSSIIVLASNITYLLFNPKMTFTQYIYLIISLEGVLGVCASSYVFFRYSKMTEFAHLLEKWHLQGHQIQDSDNGLELKLFFRLVILPTILWVAKPLMMVLFFEDDIELAKVQIYVYPSPIVLWISTKYHFLLMQLFQTITFIPVNGFIHLTGQMCTTICTEYSYHFDELQKSMRFYSKQTASALEFTYKLEMDNNKSKVPSRVLPRIQQKRRLELNDKFERNFVTCIKRYQKLIASFQYFKQQTEIGFALTLSIVYPSLLLCSYKLLWDYRTGEGMDFRLAGLCVLALDILYRCCGLGCKLQEMGNNIREEIYSTPWYFLEPKMRKIVHIFLCYDQKAYQFRAFGVFSAQTTTFTRLMVMWYAFILIQVFFIFKE